VSGTHARRSHLEAVPGEAQTQTPSSPESTDLGTEYINLPLMRGATDSERLSETRIQEVLGQARENLQGLSEAPNQADFDLEKSQRKRGQRVLIALLALAVVGGYVFTYFVSRDVGAGAARDELLFSTVASLEATNIEREKAGLAPINIPAVVEQAAPGGVVDQGAIIDAVTLNVLARMETSDRFRGAAGAAGLPGRDGAPCLPTDPRCVGPAGQPGADGEDGADSIVPGPKGADGEDGADSTVPGPIGPIGPVGPAGPTCPEGTTEQQAFARSAPDITADFVEIVACVPDGG